MSHPNVLKFLTEVAARADLLDGLKVRGKGEVLAAAAQFGYPFSEGEFNGLIWNLEAALAAKRGEAFDLQSPMWHLMWGRYYLEYLVTDLLPSMTEEDVAKVLASLPAAS